MFREIPEEVSQKTITFKVEELEPLLAGPKSQLPKFEPKEAKLKTGETMLIREMKKEEVPQILKFIKKLIDVDRDFYDIVSVRVYAELLGWYRNRLKDPFTLIGLVDGKLAGFCNGRKWDDEIAISLHTMAFKRGAKVGAILYYTKTKYAFETLGVNEWWSTFESYNGLKRWGIGMAQPSYPWPDYQHELGGAKVYYITREYWDSTVNNYLEGYIGVGSITDASEETIKKNENLIVPEEPEV
jgi:hypothetical protein